MALTVDFRSILDSRRFSREQAETLIELLQRSARPSPILLSVGSAVWTNQPAAATPLFGEAAGARSIPLDLSMYTEARITATIATIGHTTATLALYRAITAPLTAGSYSAVGSVSMGIAATGIVDSGWQTIPESARTLSFCSVWGIGGNAVADPAIGSVTLWLR